MYDALIAIQASWIAQIYEKGVDVWFAHTCFSFRTIPASTGQQAPCIQVLWIGGRVPYDTLGGTLRVLPPQPGGRGHSVEAHAALLVKP